MKLKHNLLVALGVASLATSCGRIVDTPPALPESGPTPGTAAAAAVVALVDHVLASVRVT